MKLNELSAQLSSVLTDNIIYLTCETDLTDFRKKTPPKLKVNISNKSVEIVLPAPDAKIGTLIGLLSVSLFAPKNVIIGWNLKDLFSWFRFHYSVAFPVNCKIFDLRLIEAFSDEIKGKPSTYDEAISRLRIQLGNDAIMAVNNHVYAPLSTSVIPAIETAGLITQDPPSKLYSSYTIEGQINGRLNSNIPFDGSFNPHNLTEEMKNNFYPGMEKTFLIFDFKYLEVKLLQWITKDEKLAKIIESGEDVYEGIYRAISGAPKCSPKNRDFMKKTFLQTIYGIQSTSLAEQSGISANGAQTLIDKITQTFSKAFDYLHETVESARKQEWVKDKLGRKSVYYNNSADCFDRGIVKAREGNRKPYTARNAVIQAPAAMVCQEKLCDLYGQMLPNMTIVASIHDAYICIAPKSSAVGIAKSCVELLRTESMLAPGLYLDVTARMGDQWGTAETIIFEDM